MRLSRLSALYTKTTTSNRQKKRATAQPLPLWAPDFCAEAATTRSKCAEQERQTKRLQLISYIAFGPGGARGTVPADGEVERGAESGDRL